MELAPLLFGVIAGGIASFIMGLLESWGFRKRRDPDEVADDVAAVAAQEAVEVMEGEHVPPPPPAAPVEFRHSPTTRELPGATAPSVPKPPEADEKARQMKILGEQLANDPQFREALGIKKKTRATWVVQGLVTAALLAVSVYSFATNTETGVGFAFCGSLGGFWMREITG